QAAHQAQNEMTIIGIFAVHLTGAGRQQVLQGGSRSRHTKNNDPYFHGRGRGEKRRPSSTHTAEVKSLYSLRLALGLIRKTGFPPRLQHGCALWSTQGILPV